MKFLIIKRGAVINVIFVMDKRVYFQAFKWIDMKNLRGQYMDNTTFNV